MLTDEDLDRIERLREPNNAGIRALTYAEWYPLMREVRRLRSDEWLEKAAQEMEAEVDRLIRENENSVLHGRWCLAILRKHRDAR